MDLIEYWKAEKTKLLQANRDVTDKADAEGRGLSEDERSMVEKNFAAVAEYDVKINDEDDKRRVRDITDQFMNGFSSGEYRAGGVPVPREAQATVKAKSLGDAFVESEAYKGLQARIAGGQRPPEGYKIEVPVDMSVAEVLRFKAAGDPVLESDSTDIFGTGGSAGQLSTQVAPIWPLQPALRVADLIPSVPVTVGNSAYWLEVETRGAISGTPQTEGSAKPGGEYVFSVNSAALQTLAGYIKISEQYLEDAPAVVAYINQDLPYQIRFNEDAYLMGELYTGANLSADGTTLQATPNGFDAIREAVALIQENNGNATGLVISPLDWAALQTEQFAGAGGYIGGGPGQNPWGLTVVVTTAATEGLPLVGDFARAARVFRRGGVNIASTNSDGTDFVNNVVTIRAEMREIIGISYPNLLSVAVIGTS